MQSSSILSKICEIKERIALNRFLPERRETSLHDYIVGLNDTRKVIYISAKVKESSLDTGSDQTTLICREPGDRPALYIGKQLGGNGKPRNVFPLNEQLDTSSWKADEDHVYAHVKKGGNRHACLMYGIEFNMFFGDEASRAYQIHYHFQLYENEQVVKTIEGMFENTSPKLTKEDYVHQNGCPRPYPFRDGFKFEPYLFYVPPKDSDDE